MHKQYQNDSKILVANNLTITTSITGHTIQIQVELSIKNRFTTF